MMKLFLCSLLIIFLTAYHDAPRTFKFPLPLPRIRSVITHDFYHTVPNIEEWLFLTLGVLLLAFRIFEHFPLVSNVRFLPFNSMLNIRPKRRSLKFEIYNSPLFAIELTLLYLKSVTDLDLIPIVLIFHKTMPFTSQIPKK